MVDKLFTLLKDSVRVLVVDDEPLMRVLACDNLGAFPIYSITVASSTAEAVAVLDETRRRFHVCVMDRGLCDVQSNEFYLLDAYKEKMPFIVITAREDTEKGFECCQRGAKHVISKGSPGFHDKMLATINKLALTSIVFPGYHERPSPFLSRCVELMIEKRPRYVKDVAQGLNMTDKAVRNGWKKYLGIEPKYSLCIFHLYLRAFERVEEICKKGILSHTEKTADELRAGAKARELDARCCRYYRKHKAHIDAIIHNPR
jgi:CheY-like chemotaxis protein